MDFPDARRITSIGDFWRTIVMIGVQMPQYGGFHDHAVSFGVGEDFLTAQQDRDCQQPVQSLKHRPDKTTARLPARTG